MGQGLGQGLGQGMGQLGGAQPALTPPAPPIPSSSNLYGAAAMQGRCVCVLCVCALCVYAHVYVALLAGIWSRMNDTRLPPSIFWNPRL